MPSDTPDVTRADFDALAARVKRLEALVPEQRSALEREMRAGFQGINARFDGLEAELRFRFEQLDRIEETLAFIRSRFNGHGQS
jgi:hypothetical protein